MTLKEHIDDIRKGLETGQYGNEAAVSLGILLRLLGALGWPTYDTQVVIPEYGVKGTRVDFALCHPPSKPCVFIEVKKVGNIDGAEQQLFEYAFHEGVPIAILTDGRKWRFFHPTAQGNYGERKVCELNLSEGNSEENTKCFKRYLNYEAIQTGEAIEAVKADYEKVVQQRQVATRLPEAWSKLVEEADEFLLHAVAEKTESLCGYKPTDEQVLDFLKDLERKTELDRRGPSSPSGQPTQSRARGTQNTPQKRLVVTMSNGEVIDHNTAATTFAEVIEKLGIERVRDLKHKVGRLPLISTSKDPILGQRKSGRYYIMTNTNTKKKKAILEKIASELDERLKVEIVEKS